MDDLYEENQTDLQNPGSPILNDSSRKGYYVRNENIELPKIYNILQQYLRKTIELPRAVLENYYTKITTMRLHHTKNRLLLLKIRGILEFILKRRSEFNTQIQDGRICIFENCTNQNLTKAELEDFYQKLLNCMNTKIDNKTELFKFLHKVNSCDYDPADRWLVLKIKGLLKYILKSRCSFMKSLSKEEITIYVEDDGIVNQTATRTQTSPTPTNDNNFIIIEADNNGNIEEFSSDNAIPLTNDNFVTITVQNADNIDDCSKMEIDNEIYQNMGSLPDLSECTNTDIELASEKSLIFTKHENELSKDLFDTDNLLDDSIFKVPPLPPTKKIDNTLPTPSDGDHDYCSNHVSEYVLTREMILDKMSTINTIEQSKELLKESYDDCKKMVSEFVDCFKQMIDSCNKNDETMIDTTITDGNTQIYDAENSRIIQEVVDRFKDALKNEPDPFFKEASLHNF